MQYLKSYQKKKSASSPPIFFIKKNYNIKTKTCFYGKEPKSKHSMCGKIKPILGERGLELPRKKCSSLTCFFCHPHQIPAKVFLKTTRENMGIKQI
jgi:hypothetical protein